MRSRVFTCFSLISTLMLISALMLICSVPVFAGERVLSDERLNSEIFEPDGALIQKQPNGYLKLAISCSALSRIEDGTTRWIKVRSPSRFTHSGSENIKLNKPSLKDIYVPVEYALMAGNTDQATTQVCAKQFLVPQDKVFVSPANKPWHSSDLDRLSLMDFKGSINPKTGMPRRGYSLKENGLYLIPLVSAAAFIAMPDYKKNLINAPLIHALISGVGSSYLYSKRDKPYWQRVVEDEPPSGWWDVLLPLVSYGYAGYDLYSSASERDWLYVLHGGSMLSVFSAFAANGRVHLLTDTLMLENSTIFYYLRDVDPIFRVGFASTFCLLRLGLFPYGWWQYVRNVYLEGKDYPGSEITNPALLSGGLIFGGLNIYWGAKLLRYLVFGPRKKTE
ncbi:TLC domain-containing protein [Parendozoicomonas sp. Alg238-R29]|uniref:TLC domain-containing protein n=1 Tax=Parendozoicomonas sp. Alg238-R29 TaxID=2993446 RepID=UPI00248DD093|nr:TLC domain-containing protein [Parendozoicomonas sp. Alg238-R29]